MKASATMSSVEAFAPMESAGDEPAVIGMARTSVDAVIYVIIVVSFEMAAISKVSPITKVPPVGEVLPIFKVTKIMVEVAVEYKRREAHIKR